MAGTNTFAIPSASEQQIWVDMVTGVSKALSALDSSGIFGGNDESPIFDISAAYQGVKGVTFNIPTTKESTSGGKSDDEVLTNNEEAPVLSNNSGTVHIRKHAFGLPGEYEQAKTSIDFQTYFMNRMKRWGSNIRNYDFHAALTASLTYSAQHNVVYPEGAANVAGITENHKMSVAHIRKLNSKKQELGIGDVMIPGFGMVAGILLLSPAQIYDLKTDPEYQELYREADVRGVNNKLFQNNPFMLGNIDGVVVCTDKAIQSIMYGVYAGNTHLYTSTAPSGYRLVEGLFLGAAAAGYRQVRPPKSLHPDDRDYGNQFGYGMSMFYGFVKTVRNDGTISAADNHDHGLIYVPTAASIL